MEPASLAGSADDAGEVQGMRLLELTMPLDHEGMPDEALATATRFVLAPRGDPEKGITVGTDSATALLLPSQFAAFRRTRRLHEVALPELVLRETAVVDVPCGARDELRPDALAAGLAAADFRDGDALLLRTGWGDGAPRATGHDAYLLQTPHLGLEGAVYLADAMRARQSDLLLLDTALVGYPGQHLVPEWTTLRPRPACWPSEAARAYLAGYLEREVLADWAVDFRLAEAGIMTVKRLVNCGALQERRCRLIIAPLALVRGVGAPCRVVAVEGALP
jgi:kynurenine formamidase